MFRAFAPGWPAVIARAPLRRLAPAFLTMLAVSPGHAAAPEGEATPVHAERVGDWEIVCEAAKAPPSGGGPGRDCRILQRQVVRETGQSVFLATVLPAGRDGGLVAILSTPLGGYLAPGMILTVDGGRPFKVLFETCTTAGCHGGFALDGRIARELRRGKVLTVRLWTGKSAKADVAVPLAGLDRALAALKGSRS
jgi:invasion protein IalB